jgi:hypothetical protein
MGADKNSFSEELDLYPNRNSESHTNKRKHTQTSLDTLGTKLEKARKQSGSKHERTYISDPAGVVNDSTTPNSTTGDTTHAGAFM